ncbi:hypothetical protein PV433_10625 [Paenibacillus sp. GYB004]|uniref:hypothetical protein n=1 Tax=Paenibacillus sp. GYB004 TaxID=2994393 RepID=UPI002F962C1F
MKKNPPMSLDEAARRYADGHYVMQTMPGPSPERDKKVSEALAQLKRSRPVAKARQ